MIKSIGLLLLLALLLVVWVRPAGSTIESPGLTVSGAFFALSVADMNATAKWYSEKLGMKIVMQQPKREKIAVTVLESDGLIVELIQNDNSLPVSKTVPGLQSKELIQGSFKTGFIVNDFDKTLATLKARNVEIAFGPYPARAGQRANVIIKDNEGNLIQLFGK
jgi:catechol 2,3-dioxygenase-like lactoylglutathione lyase family enzyme